MATLLLPAIYCPRVESSIASADTKLASASIQACDSEASQRFLVLTGIHKKIQDLGSSCMVHQRMISEIL